jgi:putative hydrolase of the HAD superfamily
MPNKLVIFDLDNTLIKTRPAAKIGYRQAIYSLAKTLGIYDKRDKLYNHWKRIVSSLMGEKKPHVRRFAYSLQKLMEYHKIPDTHFQQTLNVYQKELLENLEPLPGAKELLSWLKENKITIAVATGSETAEAKKKLKSTGLFEYIDHLITPNDTDTMKPDPDFYLLALKLAKAEYQNAIVIGDHTKEDLEPAKKIGLATIRVDVNTPNLTALKTEITKSLNL